MKIHRMTVSRNLATGHVITRLYFSQRFPSLRFRLTLTPEDAARVGRAILASAAKELRDFND